MRKLIVVVISLWLIFPCISPYFAYAENSADYTEEIGEELDGIL